MTANFRAFTRERMFLKMSLALQKADKTESFMDDFQRSLTRILTAEYQTMAKKAVAQGVQAHKRKRKASNATVSAVIRSVNRAMQGFGSEVGSAINDQVELFYGEVTKNFVEEFLVKKASIDPELGFSLSQKDKKAIEAIQKLGVQSAGRYFPEQVADKVARVVEEVVLEEGLSTKEAATKLENELNGALGTGVAEVIPTQFSNNPQAYFSILADNASTMATNVGRLISMADAEVERYRLEAILDKRTSNICRELNGKEFSVGTAVQSVDKFIDAESLVDVQKMMPFNSQDTVPKWAEDGHGFPPFHHKCRTVAVPVF